MKRILKWLGVGAGSVASLALAALVLVYGVSARKMKVTYDIQPATLAIPTDSASIAHGRHLVRVIAKCQVCHGNSFEGGIFVEDPVIGRLAAPNITPAGVVRDYTDRDWVRAIRHGLRPDNRSVVMMPSYEFAGLSDEDLAATIAYMKTITPRPEPGPAMKLGPLAHVLIATDMFPILAVRGIDHDMERIAPPVGPTAEYGRYIAAAGCMGCHGPTLQGAKPPATGPDITPGGRLAGWSEDDFRLMMRTGKRPDGTVVDSEMPWNVTAGMTDVELAAVWAYLNSVVGRDVATTGQ